jgi:hypothetical protein
MVPLALALLLLAAGVPAATFRAALPVDPMVLAVTPAAVRSGESLTWTVRGRPGQFAAIAFSRAASGASFQGTPLALGTDARLLFSGTVDAGGRFAVTLVVPTGISPGPYYFQAVVADDPAYTVNPILSGGTTVTVADVPVGTLTGRVTEVGARALPVANAVVEIDGGRFRGLTGPDGRFTIEGVPLGPHTVTTTRDSPVPAENFYPVTLPRLELSYASRELNLTLLRTLIGIPGDPPECPCLVAVEVPNAGSAEVTVLVENAFLQAQRRFQPTTTSGRSPLGVPFNGPLEGILDSHYEVTVSAPGFLSVTLRRVNIPWLGRITVVLPPA